MQERGLLDRVTEADPYMCMYRASPARGFWVILRDLERGHMNGALSQSTNPPRSTTP